MTKVLVSFFQILHFASQFVCYIVSGPAYSSIMSVILAFR